MKITKRKEKINIELEIPTYISKSGEKYELTSSRVQELVKEYTDNLLNEHKKLKYGCIDNDTVYDFMSFDIDLKDKTYNEQDKDSYKHFVYHYLKKYYVDSYNSNHFYNGGNWEHTNYNPLDGLHDRMLGNSDNELKYSRVSHEGSVRELILMHLVSGGGVRMYGNAQSYKRITNIDRKDTIDNLKEFFKFVLDSKMFDINGKYEMPEHFKEENCGWWFLESMSKYYHTIAELFILQCWRSGKVEVIQWLVDEYGLDLNKAQIHNTDTSILVRIIKEMHDSRIHDSYNNGVSSRLYEYDGTPKNGDSWEQTSFDNIISVICYLHKTFPPTNVKTGDYYTRVNDDNKYEEYLETKEYDDIIDWMLDDLLEKHYTNSYYIGERESANELLNKIESELFN